MEVSLDDFRRHFELLSDAALLETNREELIDVARECFDEEVERRGLNSTAGEEAAAETVPQPANPSEELVVIATFNIPEDANLARGLLRSAEIPFHLENEYVALGGFQLRLLVPAAFEEEAREVLEAEISEEELAAQAEAAGVMEEDPEEESPEA
jgi:Putative prokaryotic signal transducing protein